MNFKTMKIIEFTLSGQHYLLMCKALEYNYLAIFIDLL